MGILVCKKCKGFYELQEGESSEDYLRCHCGGIIQYYESLEEYKEHKKDSNDSSLVFQCPDTYCGYVLQMESGDKCPKCGKTAKTMPIDKAMILRENKIKQTSKSKNQKISLEQTKSLGKSKSKSSGSTVLIIFLILIILPIGLVWFVIGPMMVGTSPNPGNPNSGTVNSGIVIEVTSTPVYNNYTHLDDKSTYWTGSYGDESGSQSVSGSGKDTFQIKGNPKVVSATFQSNENKYNPTLTVQIIKDGVVLETRSTDVRYGVVSVSHSFND